MTAFVIDTIPQTANRMRRNKFFWTQKDLWVKRILEVAGPGPWHATNGNAKVKSRVGITVHRQRSQDPDNAVASTKPLLDALKKSGWIVDDSWTWLELHVWERKCQRGDERTEIVVEFLQEAVTGKEATK